MKTITLAEFEELIEHEDWAHSQEVLVMEESFREEWDDESFEIVIITGGYGTVQKISVLDSVKITYAEHFEFDDFEPRSLKIHDVGDYEWSIEGVEVVESEDGEEQDILDLREYLPAEFSEIDYAFLQPKLRKVIDAVDDGADGETCIIPVSNAPDIRFAGEKIAEVSSSKHRDSEFYSGKTGRWTELLLYKTKGGKFVCQQVGRTEWAGEYDRHSAEVCATLDDVKKFFGFGWLAKRLYRMAQIDSPVMED